MKSTAATVADYLATLPQDRRAPVEAVRNVILKNLDRGYEECMLWGVAAYVVPQRAYPPGHHTDPKKPLMMCGVSSQKNDMVVYLMNVFGGGGGLGGDAELREWFEEAWVKAGKTLGMCVAGAGGCCVRFKKLDDISLDVIGEAVRRTPVKKYVANYARMLASRGKGAGAPKVKGGKTADKGMATKKAEKQKTAVKKTVKKTAKR